MDYLYFFIENDFIVLNCDGYYWRKVDFEDMGRTKVNNIYGKLTTLMRHYDFLIEVQNLVTNYEKYFDYYQGEYFLQFKLKSILEKWSDFVMIYSNLFKNVRWLIHIDNYNCRKWYFEDLEWCLKNQIGIINEVRERRKNQKKQEEINKKNAGIKEKIEKHGMGYLYVMKTSNPYIGYKIGSSKDYTKRNVFSVKIPVDYEFIITKLIKGFRRCEQLLHKHFKDKRMKKTEFFDLTKDDLKFIEEYKIEEVESEMV